MHAATRRNTRPRTTGSAAAEKMSHRPSPQSEPHETCFAPRRFTQFLPVYVQTSCTRVNLASGDHQEPHNQRFRQPLRGRTRATTPTVRYAGPPLTKTHVAHAPPITSLCCMPTIVITTIFPPMGEFLWFLHHPRLWTRSTRIVMGFQESGSFSNGQLDKWSTCLLAQEHISFHTSRLFFSISCHVVWFADQKDDTGQQTKEDSKFCDIATSGLEWVVAVGVRSRILSRSLWISCESMSSMLHGSRDIISVQNIRENETHVTSSRKILR